MSQDIGLIGFRAREALYDGDLHTGLDREAPCRAPSDASCGSVMNRHPVPARPSGNVDVVTELHVRIPDDVAERLAERAEREHTTSEQLASDAVATLVGPAPQPAPHKFGFIALGDSGRSDISERAEEILRSDFGA